MRKTIATGLMFLGIVLEFPSIIVKDIARIIYKDVDYE